MVNKGQATWARFKGTPRGKIIITTTALLVTVPVGAAAITINARQDSARPASISVHANTSASPAGPPAAHTELNVQTEAPANTANNSSHASVTVNGQTLDVPENGSLNQTIETGSGAVNVQASAGQASNNSSSSTNINVHSSTNSNSNSWSSTNVSVNQ